MNWVGVLILVAVAFVAGAAFFKHRAKIKAAAEAEAAEIRASALRRINAK